MTGGEKYLANKFEQKLEDDWLVDSVFLPI